MNAPATGGVAPSERAPLVALVAGEDSGDQLGADLIEALRVRCPGASFVGVGGPRMRAAGFEAWHDVSELSVMGVAEVLRHLPRLLRLRASLSKRLIASKPDAFIGIDAPDFNLGLEKKLKRAGIPTVHYVSPSVWAWREQRADKIGQSADCVLCLFPMEPAIYARHAVAAQFVGHPLADRFPLDPDRGAARRELGLDDTTPVLAVLPGSRLSEIYRLGAIFLDAAQRAAEEIPGLQIVIPTANTQCRDELEAILHRDWSGDHEPGIQHGLAMSGTSGPQSPAPSPLLLDGDAHRALISADVVLLASGTAALEALLAKRPMVVGYRVAPLTHALVRGLRMLKSDVYSLPNILAGRRLVPELMQGDCTPENLATAVLQWFRDPGRITELVHEFERMHLALHVGGGAAVAAARAIEQLVSMHDDAPHVP